MTAVRINEVAEKFLEDLFTKDYAQVNIKAEKGYEIIYSAKVTKENDYELRRTELFGEKENGKVLRPCFLKTDSDDMLNSLILDLRTDLERYC